MSSRRLKSLRPRPTAAASAVEIDAVFFDLDGTLLDDEAGMLLALADTVEELRAGLPEGVGESVLSAYPVASERFWSSPAMDPRAPGDPASIAAIRATVWAQTLATLGINDRTLAERISVVYAAARRRHHFAYEESAGVLRALQGKKPLGLITNGPGDGQREKLNVTGLTGFFDAIVPSGEVGAGKPLPEIFEYALSALGVTAGRAVHVGDNLMADIGGANGAGMLSVWINRRDAIAPPEAAVADAEIRTLTELPDVLQRLSAS